VHFQAHTASVGFDQRDLPSKWGKNQGIFYFFLKCIQSSTLLILYFFHLRLSPSLGKADALESSLPTFRTAIDQVLDRRREESAIDALLYLGTESPGSAEPKPINHAIKTGETKENLPLALPVDYKEKCLLDAVSETDEDVDEEPEYDDEPSDKDQNSDDEFDEEFVEPTAKSCPIGEGNENENDMNVPIPGPTFPPSCKPSCLPVSCSHEKKRKRPESSLDNQSPIKYFNIGDSHEDIEQHVEKLNGPNDNNAAVAAQLDQKADNSWIAENFFLLLRSYEILQTNHLNHLKTCEFEKAQMLEEIQTLSEKNKILSSLNQAQQETKDNRKECSDLRQKFEQVTQELDIKKAYSTFLLKQLENAFEFIQQHFSSSAEMDAR